MRTAKTKKIYADTERHSTDVSGIISMEFCQAWRWKAVLAEDNLTEEKRTPGSDGLMYSKSFKGSGKTKPKSGAHEKRECQTTKPPAYKSRRERFEARSSDENERRMFLLKDFILS
jgi:hypothetical protein